MRNLNLYLLTVLLFPTVSQAQSDMFKTSDIPKYHGETYESIMVEQYLKKYPKIKEIVDISSLHVINNNYAIDHNNAYYGSKIISGADIKTFSPYKLSSHFSDYATDSNHVYLEGEQLPLATPSHFNELGYSSRNRYSIDGHYVYFNNEMIRGADPKSFILGNNGHAQDHQYVYYGAKKLENSNAKTFRFLGEDNTGYAADINQVYYFPDIIEGANPQTFQLLNKLTAKDDHALYSRAKKFEGVKDIKTLQIFHSYYPYLSLLADQYHVYYLEYDDFYIISDADINTFKILPARFDQYARDKNHVYTFTSQGYSIFEKLNPQTTQIKGPFLNDGQHLYNTLSSWQSKLTKNEDFLPNRIPLSGYESVAIIDLPSFQYLAGPYAMDKDIVVMGRGHTLTVLGKRAELQPKLISRNKKPKYLIKIGEECFDINTSKHSCPAN